MIVVIIFDYYSSSNTVPVAGLPGAWVPTLTCMRKGALRTERVKIPKHERNKLYHRYVVKGSDVAKGQNHAPNST